MKKNAFGYLGFSILLAAWGYFLRSRELYAISPEVDGLTLAGTRETWVMGCCSAALILIAVCVGIVYSRKNRTEETYEKAFRYQSPVLFPLYLLSGLAVAGGTVLCWYAGVFVPVAVANLVLVLGILTGGSLIVRGVFALRGKKHLLLTVLSCVSPVFLCLLLVLIYKRNDNNPQLAQFAYRCLAIAVLCLSSYFSCGYCSGRKAPGKYLAVSVMVPFFVGATIAESWTLGEQILLISLAVFAMLEAAVFLANGENKVRRH